jgi:hypothetical protein
MQTEAYRGQKGSNMVQPEHMSEPLGVSVSPSVNGED